MDFVADSAVPLSKCECCQPEETSEIMVSLKCADGKNWDQKIVIPTSCTCQRCAGEEKAEHVTKIQKALEPFSRLKLKESKNVSFKPYKFLNLSKGDQ